MKKGLLSAGAILVMSTFASVAQADCVVELQMNGRLLGGSSNIFRGYECRDALRSCMQKKLQLERNNGNLGALTCQTVSNSGPITQPPHNGGGNGGYYPPNPPPQSSDMSRYELIMAMERIENTQDDAERMVDLILSMNRNGSGTVRELAQTYEVLLRMHGGSSNTADAINDLNKLDRKAKNNRIAISHQLQRYQLAAAVENTLDDAHTVMDRVEQADNTFRVGFDQSLEIYKDILRFAGGSSNTADALSVMQKILTIGNAHLTYDLYKQFRVVENTIDDAFAAINLIYLAQSYGISIQEARTELERITRQYGSSNTAEAHRRFRYLYNF